MKSSALGTVLLGGMFVLCGSIWLISNLVNVPIRFDLLWPLFLLLPGLGFWFGYLVDRKDWGLTIPGTILTILGSVFFLNIFVDEVLNYGTIWAVTAFMYPGAVAVALWIGWLLSGREIGMAIGAGILSIISLFVFCTTTMVIIVGDTLFGNTATKFVWPLGLLCLGFFILITPAFGLIGKERKRSWEKAAEDFGASVEKWGEKLEAAIDGIDKEKPAADVEEAEVVEKNKDKKA